MKCPKCHADNPDTSRYCSNCAAPLPSFKEYRGSQTATSPTLIKELTTGSTFAGRYQVIEELGQGGMGRVYKVYDTKIKDKIALKLIKPEIASDAETIERFGNELRLARKISQRNVCRMFDLGEAEGAHFITMEYVHGEDLKSMIRMSTGLTVGTVLSVGKQVCEGLAEAHSLGIVHRDLKPQNIMIDRGGNAKIMDFGVARSLKQKGITGASTMIGTPEYMSPEQAEAKSVDARSDIYSLGIILYEMATGRVPFEGDTALSIAMKHKGETPKSPRQLNPNIPTDLASVILRCLAKDKEKRYQTAGELHAELDKIEKGLPTTERVVPERKPVTSREITITLGIKKLALPILAVIILAAAVVTGVHFLSKKKPVSELTSNLSLAVMPFDDLSQDKTHEYIGNGIADTLISALSTVPGLRVPARTSSFSLKGKDMDVHSIGQKLNVKTVLEGSVQVAGDKLRITARLSNADDGFQIWSEVYERTSQDIFAIQDDIAQKIIKALKITLLGEKETQIVTHTTTDNEAYDFYMKGLYFEAKRGKANLDKAVAFYQAAIEKDPGYALAFARLANALRTEVVWGFAPGREAFPRALSAANKCLELAPSLSEGHTALAEVKYLFDWDDEGAEKEFGIALRLNPNDSNAHKEFAQFLSARGRGDESLQEYKKAQELDPLSLIIPSLMGAFLPLGQRIERYRKILEMDPEFEPAQTYLARSYVGQKNYNKALEIYKKLDQWDAVASTYIQMGKISEARQVLNKLLESPVLFQNSLAIARLCFLLGRKNEGFDWLEKAYEDRDRGMLSLDTNPDFKSARGDPRFEALLKKIGPRK